MIFFHKSIYECVGFYDDISKNVLVVPNYHFIGVACNAGDLGSIPELGRPLEKRTATHSRILAEEFHGQRSLAGYSPWDRKESDRTVTFTSIINSMSSN